VGGHKPTRSHEPDCAISSKTHIMNISAQFSPARRKGLMWVAALVAAGALAWTAFELFVSSKQQITDNAYVMGHVTQVTPQIAGTVLEVKAEETDRVQVGQTLIRLDPADASVAWAQAEAQLAQTVRDTAALYAQTHQLEEMWQAKKAEAARAQADVDRLQADVQRRQPLLPTGAVGQEEYDRSARLLEAGRQNLNAAQAAVRAAHEQWQASLSQTQGVPLPRHPNVLKAVAHLREADLAMQRVTIRSPIAGHVVKRQVQVGHRVQPGTPLLTVVSLDQLWVDANFKESQLQDIRIGQPVEMESDVFGSKVIYHGKVMGLGAGTGSAFALLPAQNATGNWIKVVQRVPVRISLDPQELAHHPLRVGLSMEVTVDTHDRNGRMLSDVTADVNSQVSTNELTIDPRLQRKIDQILSAHTVATRH
jgi:membrane fusion protein (multidrug efflux system)